MILISKDVVVKVMPYGHKHRDRIDIISHILETANGSYIKKTKIMNTAFLSYYQLNEYLTVLTRGDLLCYDLDSRTFKTTEKGIRFLNTRKQMDQMMNALTPAQL
ncbi:MAG TPA: winged helix-turn-helix domain-containing protein [Nitrososphaeraceae archaeon]|nr:winged helix-turn-helix domain-containing protein [Nitrososphaeraceae archaeon]